MKRESRLNYARLVWDLFGSEALRSHIDDALANLPERYRAVLSMRSSEPPVTFLEIGKGLNVGPARVQQIDARGIARLRRSPRLKRYVAAFAAADQAPARQPEPTNVRLYTQVKDSDRITYRGFEVANSALCTSVDDLDLSPRTRVCLFNLGIKTLGELCHMSPSALLRTKNLGRKTLRELEECLAAHGLCLEMSAELPPPKPGLFWESIPEAAIGGLP